MKTLIIISALVSLGYNIATKVADVKPVGQVTAYELCKSHNNDSCEELK